MSEGQFSEGAGVADLPQLGAGLCTPPTQVNPAIFLY